MEVVKIRSKNATVFGKSRGNNSNKWNRMAKLASRYNELEKKFEGMVDRGSVTTHTARCALACLLMMHTGIRVGNEGSAEGYMTKPHPNQKDKKPEFVQTYGLTTLEKRHFRIDRNEKEVEIFFLGKKQVDNAFLIQQRNLVKWLTELITNTENDTDKVFGITDYELTKFIKKYVGKCFSPKDFRCMKANLYAWEFFKSEFPAEVTTKKELRANTKLLFEFVSTKLNNTPGVCRKSYVSDRLVLHIEETVYSKP